MAAHRHLIRHAIEQGWTIQCEDYDRESQWVYFTNNRKAVDYIEAVDGGLDFQIISPDEKSRIFVMLAIGYGNLPDETVADFTVHPFIDAWFNEYSNKYVSSRCWRVE
jgi:hypothetical protein